MDTLKLAEDLEREHVFPPEQARAFTRIWAGMSKDTYATKADLEVAVLRLEARISDSQKELVKWFAGIMIVQGLAVIGGTATLVKML